MLWVPLHAAAVQGKDIYISSKLAMVELIMSGCTCSSDHLYIYPNDVTLEDSIQAARYATHIQTLSTEPPNL